MFLLIICSCVSHRIRFAANSSAQQSRVQKSKIILLKNDARFQSFSNINDTAFSERSLLQIKQNHPFEQDHSSNSISKPGNYVMSEDIITYQYLQTPLLNLSPPVVDWEVSNPSCHRRRRRNPTINAIVVPVRNTKNVVWWRVKLPPPWSLPTTTKQWEGSPLSLDSVLFNFQYTQNRLEIHKTSTNLPLKLFL